MSAFRLCLTLTQRESVTIQYDLPESEIVMELLITFRTVLSSDLKWIIHNLHYAACRTPSLSSKLPEFARKSCCTK